MPVIGQPGTLHTVRAVNSDLRRFLVARVVPDVRLPAACVRSGHGTTFDARQGLCHARESRTDRGRAVVSFWRVILRLPLPILCRSGWKDAEADLEADAVRDVVYSRANAIFVPSGDHAGWFSKAAVRVSRVSPVPSMLMTYSSDCRPTLRTNATC